MAATPSKETSIPGSTKISTSTIETLSLTVTLSPAPSETPAPLPPEAFNPESIPTFTPSAPAQCPAENSSLEFDAKSAEAIAGSVEPNVHFAEYVLHFLNSGGTFRSILSAFGSIYGRQVDIFSVQDVTGDDIPELIFPYAIWIDVFGCTDGSYELLFSGTYESDLGGVRIIDINDLNRDGLAEIVAYFDGCLGNRCPSISVYEWDGKEFRDLTANSVGGAGCGSLPVAPFEVRVQDIDHNGTKEIILHNNGDPQPDNDFPYRKETRICMWNGQSLVIYERTFDAPYYRFQAVQDGDRATLAGDYTAAFGYYQRTISDKNLEWFTQERKWHDFWIYSSHYFASLQEPTPRASPSMGEDPDEYPMLAAYAYYRMMLVYILQNNRVKAEATFIAEQNAFPPENYFVQVASVFWDAYKRTTSISSSCGDVIQYTLDHPVPTKYLGDWDHGVQSTVYTSESICPFG